MIWQDWTLAISIIAITWLVTTTTRIILKRFQRFGKWNVVHDLGPPLSNLLYIIGLKLFVDAAPISRKIELWLDGAIFIVGVLIILRLIQKAMLFAIHWGTSRTSSAKSLELGFVPLLQNFTTLFILLSGGIIILKHFNYDVLSLVTALGVSSLAVGLAAKDTLSHMISGFVLIMDRNLSPGDRVSLSGSTGDVEKIGLRSTQIRLLSEGKILIVPNSELVNTKLLNLSLPSRGTSCSLTIRVPVSHPFKMTKEICLKATQSTSRISKEKPSGVYLVSLADGHQVIRISFWVNEMNDTESVISDFHEHLLEMLQTEKIQLLGPAQGRPTT